MAWPYQDKKSMGVMFDVGVHVGDVNAKALALVRLWRRSIFFSCTDDAA